MVGIELDESAMNVSAEERGAGWAVCARARERGMLLRPLGPVVVFMPPLASTKEQLAEMTAILSESIRGLE